MIVSSRFAWLTLVAGLLCGCGKPATNAPVATTNAPRLLEITNAQPGLQTIKLWLGPYEIEAEMALKPIEMRTGMMFRTNMEEMAGMLFVYPYPTQVSFWMKNTSLPLDIGYLDADGILQEIHHLEPFDTNAVDSASDQIQYVLEVNQGWFERHQINTGTLVRSEVGPLRKTFVRQR